MCFNQNQEVGSLSGKTMHTIFTSFLEIIPSQNDNFGPWIHAARRPRRILAKIKETVNDQSKKNAFQHGGGSRFNVLLAEESLEKDNQQTNVIVNPLLKNGPPDTMGLADIEASVPTVHKAAHNRIIKQMARNNQSQANMEFNFSAPGPSSRKPEPKVIIPQPMSRPIAQLEEWLEQEIRSEKCQVKQRKKATTKLKIGEDRQSISTQLQMESMTPAKRLRCNEIKWMSEVGESPAKVTVAASLPVSTAAIGTAEATVKPLDTGEENTTQPLDMVESEGGGEFVHSP